MSSGAALIERDRIVRDRTTSVELFGREDTDGRACYRDPVALSTDNKLSGRCVHCGTMVQEVIHLHCVITGVALGNKTRPIMTVDNVMNPQTARIFCNSECYQESNSKQNTPLIESRQRLTAKEALTEMFGPYHTNWHTEK